MPIFRQLKHLPRYQRIVGVFARHGFGSFIEQFRLDRYLPLPVNLIRHRDRHEKITPAHHFRLALEELGPTFIKLGQIVSTRPDLLPADFIIELARLQDSVKPEPWDEIEALLIEEYGPEYRDLFPEIDPEPLGSASLSQVHAGRLVGGEQIVLKIQRPNIVKTIETDLEILTELARLAQRTDWGQLYDPVNIVKDFAYVMVNELDFRMEGVNADRFRANFAHERGLYIPTIYWDYCTRRVLVEERLCGIKIDQIEAIDATGLDRRKIAARAANLFVKEIIEDGFFHADPHPGNFYILDRRPDQSSPMDPAEKPASTPDLDEKSFSGDEFLIGAMDFGMVGFVSQSDRFNLLLAFMLASRRDSKGLVEHLVRIGAVSTGEDLSRLEFEIDRLLVRYQGIALKHIQSRQVVEDLMQLAFEHRVHLPTDFWLLFKTLTMMDGLARRIDPEIDVFAILGAPVRKLVREMHLPWIFGPQLLGDLQDLALALKDLPATGEHLLRSIQTGNLPVSFQMGMKKDTLDRLDRLSTRISLSVLIAAFILGQALLFEVARQSPMAMALLVAGFIASLLLGLWYVITMLKSSK